MGEHKEYSVTKALEILQVISVTLQDLDLVIAALGKSVGIMAEIGKFNHNRILFFCVCEKIPIAFFTPSFIANIAAYSTSCR